MWGCLLYVLGIGSLVFAACLVVLRLYAQYSLGVCRSRASMKGKTVVITGANSGIGKETARDLARRGAKVIMACRNLEAANQARDEIIQSTGNKEVVVKKLDLSSLQSVREFAEDVNRSETKLDVLIHNAGTADMFKSVTTGDGLEYTMATNHFGPFLLTHLLIDLLKRSQPSRIVVVASELYHFGRLNLQKLNPIGTLPAYLYYVSKRANIAFSLELARRLKGTGVTVNCLHPGMVDSGIWRNVPFPLNLPLIFIIKGFFKTPEQGAQTTIQLAVADELEHVTGRYFLDCKKFNLTKGVRNPAKGKKLWELSETFVGLKPTDPHI